MRLQAAPQAVHADLDRRIGRWLRTACEFGGDACPTDDVPDAQREWIALNRELAAQWKPIIERKPAPPDADAWKDARDKLKYLEK